MSMLTMMIVLCVGLFAGMLLMLKLGKQYGEYRLKEHPNTAQAGTSTVEAAIAAFLGLLIAFTFSNAVTQFENRRHLTVQEANAITSAYQRLDVLPSAERTAIQQMLKDYVDLRLKTYAAFPDYGAVKAAHAESVELQHKIWEASVYGLGRPRLDTTSAVVLLPALQEMFNISVARMSAFETHPPKVVYALLFLTALINAGLIGSGMAASRRISWVHAIGFSAVLAFGIFVILDVEYPRYGIFRIDSVDQMLIDAKNSLK